MAGSTRAGVCVGWDWGRQLFHLVCMPVFQAEIFAILACAKECTGRACTSEHTYICFYRKWKGTSFASRHQFLISKAMTYETTWGRSFHSPEISEISFRRDVTSTKYAGSRIHFESDISGTYVLSSLVNIIILKEPVFKVVVPCTLIKVYQCFSGPCCLQHQGNVESVWDTETSQPRHNLGQTSGEQGEDWARASEPTGDRTLQPS
jgi:hypothetical protein